MTELSAYRVYTKRDAGAWGYDPFSEFTDVELNDEQVYIKSEADAYIAELKSERDGAMGLNRIGMTLEDYQAAADKMLNHQKYKRCLAMVRWCHNQREIYERDSYNWELNNEAVDSLRNKANIMRKWRNRWLKIAEQFKEAK